MNREDSLTENWKLIYYVLQKLDIRYMRSVALVFLLLYTHNPTSTTMETIKSPEKTAVPVLI